MSRPAVSCSFTMHDTASRYCSRKRESPRASLKARPRSTSVNHDGRGQEPVTVVGSVSSRVALSMPGFLRRVGYTKSVLTMRLTVLGHRLNPLEPVTGTHYPPARDCRATTGGSPALARPSDRASWRYIVASLSGARGPDLVLAARNLMADGIFGRRPGSLSRSRAARPRCNI